MSKHTHTGRPRHSHIRAITISAPERSRVTSCSYRLGHEPPSHLRATPQLDSPLDSTTRWEFAILTTANPLKTESELAKQVRDSGTKLGIASPEEVHKLIATGVRTILTSSPSGDHNELSIEEFISGHDPKELPNPGIDQSDTAAILYSSGTTGTSKGVILTHANFISIMKLLKWSVDVTSSQNDVFLCFIPMFHIYGLAFFGPGLFCSGVATVLMPRFDFRLMLEAIQTHQVNNVIPQ